MQKEQLRKPEVASEERKAYRKPQLVEYGRVGEVTQGGGASFSYESGLYTYTSNP